MSAAATTPPARPPRIPKDPPPEVTSSPRLQRLRDAVAAARGAVARRALTGALWAEAASSGTPLVEAPWPGDDDHRVVTFLWRDRHGPGPGTRAVVLLANKLTDPSVWEKSLLYRIEGTDVWHRSYRLPVDWQGTYQLAPDDGPQPAASEDGPVHGPRSRWAGVATSAVADPFCRTQLAGKPGELPSSVGILEGAPPQPWRERRAGVPRGTLTEDAVHGDGLVEPRRVWVYAPANAAATGLRAEAPPGVGGARAGQTHDLLVLLDGEDWAGRLDLASTLDNLLADGRIRPTVAVLVDAVDTPTRWQELTCNPDFTDFLTGDLLAWARALPGVSPDPARTTISGRSLGALTALYAGLRAPTEFGAIHAQSTSLWWPSEPTADGREPGWLVRELAAARALPPRISLEVGRQEWMLHDPGAELARLLEARGDVAVRFAPYEGGHDAWCWRGGLADALAEFSA